MSTTHRSACDFPDRPAADSLPEAVTQGVHQMRLGRDVDVIPQKDNRLVDALFVVLADKGSHMRQ